MLRKPNLVAFLLVCLLPTLAFSQFYKPATYGNGYDWIRTHEADLNNDGKEDVVTLTEVSTQSGNTYEVVSVLGNGKGGFGAPIASPVTGINNPYLFNFAVGNFTSSGFPDVVFTGSDPVTGVAAIGVMLGQGNGSFGATQVFDAPLASGAAAIVTGDFTGHGNIDIALWANGKLIVFPGKGDGTFSSAITSPAATGSSCLGAADFNKDGKLDLTNGVAVFLGNGNGTFQSAIPVPDGDCNIAIADLNGDGTPDLVTGTITTQFYGIRVHLNPGNGQFDAGTFYNTGYDGGEAIRTADFNGDKATDIAALNPYDNNITVLLNQGNGTFTPSKDKNWLTGARGYDFVAGNFDSDNNSNADLVFVNSFEILSVALGNGDGTFQDAISQNVLGEPGPGYGTYIPADVNNDGKIDLVFNDGVMLGNGDGTFKKMIGFPTGCNATTVGVFSSNGKLDIAGPGTNNTGVAVCMGNGDGTFGSPTIFDSGIAHQFVLAGSFTNSGNVDLAASDQGGISILLGNGNGTFQNGIGTALNSFPAFVLGDFNNDGNLDVAAIDYPNVSVLLGQGNGKFSSPVNTSIPGAYRLYTADMNNDGKLDLVVSNNADYQYSIDIWLGNGSGGFTNSSNTSTKANSPQFLAIADFNLDGNLDIAVSGAPWYMTLLLGDGKGGVTSQTNYLSSSGVVGIFAADFNGDKKPDVVQPTFPKHPTLTTFLNLEK
jgi:hypothetical protein